MNANRMSNLSLISCPQDPAYLSLAKRKKRSLEDDVNTLWSEFVGGPGGISATEMSEDCLTLNVWAPIQEDGNVYPPGSLPVMVFIHGGGFVVGSANTNLYEGTTLSWAANATLVTLNYRLGAFGFLTKF